MKDITGQTFGQLTAIRFFDRYSKTPGKTPGTRWVFRCTCGKEIVARSGDVIYGSQVSCGCAKKKHGHASKSTYKRSSREYSSWQHMKTRTANKKHKYYHLYGGRGIKVCDRWLESFENFYEDMGPCPEGWTLERIETNGDYEPDNCIWANNTTQDRNKRNNVWIEHNGKKMILSDWLRSLGILNSAKMYYDRLKRGMTPQEALSSLMTIKKRKSFR